MNIKQNFKQSWHIIKQNKLFSGIYILGTALSIAMVMVIVVVWLAKTADIYPETNRSRMMSQKGLISKLKKDERNYGSWYASHQFVNDIIRSTPTLACACEVIEPDELTALRTPEGNKVYSVYALSTDAYFWNVFSFAFLSGTPYTAEEVQSAITKVVISKSLAEKLFGDVTAAVGKTLSLNFVDYTVCGVVKDVSGIMTASYGDVWIPISTNPSYESGFSYPYLGSVGCYILAKSSRDFIKITREVQEKVANYNHSQDEYELDLVGQPEAYYKGIMRQYANVEPNILGYLGKMALIVLILLLVPAINLAGMISSRMTKRMEEMGIRKTFGAPKRTILWQIIHENLLMTLMGGVLGLVLADIILFIGRDTLVSLIVPQVLDVTANTTFTFSMLMNPFIFLIALFICLCLNLLASLIPAIHSLKRPIVDSLNVKK